MLNVERLLEELRFVTIYPDKHNQSVWAEAETEVPLPADADRDVMFVDGVEAPRPSACGSFGCLAGNTAIHEPGVELDWYEADYYLNDGKKVVAWRADYLLNETEASDWLGNGRVPKLIKSKARELLGLTQHQAGLLFDGDNTLDELWRLAEQFSGGEIIADKYDKWLTKSYGYALAEREALEEAK